MRVSFDRAAEFYDRTRGPPKRAMKQLVRTFANELQGYRNIIDVGVGTGRFAKPLQDYERKIAGIDIARKMLEKAAEKGVKNLIRSDACFIPFKDKTFEAAICIHLLHLLSDWRKALQEICRITKDVMFSIIYTTWNPVQRAYSQILEDYGHKRCRLGKGEWELKDLVKPLKSIFAATFDNNANELISHLSERAYSGQWNVPEDVNQKAVAELKRQFSGKTFPAELRVVVWQISDLKDYCNTYIH
jgi:ubiquinone/menaquinone biosynthesis C-methylase UbiE